MQARRLQIVDSLLDLDADSHEADTIRLRLAHLARYAKFAMAGALGILFVAGLRVAASAIVGEPEIDGATAAVSGPVPSGADTSAKPLSTRGAEVLASATERPKLVVAKRRPR